MVDCKAKKPSAFIVVKFPNKDKDKDKDPQSHQLRLSRLYPIQS